MAIEACNVSIQLASCYYSPSAGVKRNKSHRDPHNPARDFIDIGNENGENKQPKGSV
jgi:hypothetical protein